MSSSGSVPALLFEAVMKTKLLPGFGYKKNIKKAAFPFLWEVSLASLVGRKPCNMSMSKPMTLLGDYQVKTFQWKTLMLLIKEQT